MRIDVVTIFPAMFGPLLSESILKRAQDSGIAEIAVRDLRDFTADRHRTTDDAPYGGGAGMVMKPEPFFEAVDATRCPETPAAPRRSSCSRPRESGTGNRSPGSWHRRTI